MATSTLDPDNIPAPDRKLDKGHGTSALGPGDTSDTGSDVQSGKRLAEPDAELGLDRGTTDDPDFVRGDVSASPDIGDAELDSDTDAEGTGERATAGRDTDIEAGSDIDIDRIDRIDDIGTEEDIEGVQQDLFAPRTRHPNRNQHSRR